MIEPFHQRGSDVMRVSVLTAPRTIELEDRPEPEPGPHDVVVRVASVGVCGSDVHYYQEGRIGPFVVEAPLVLGHEAAGEVVALGAQASRHELGARVSIEPGVPDFTCPQCLAGRYNLCPNMRFYATPPIDGAFAEYVVIHEAFAHPVPESVSDDAAALLEPLSVGLWACQKTGVAPGERVLVNGAGPIGLVSVQSALAYGATEVVVADVNPHRLAVAEAIGATRTIDVRETPLHELGDEIAADALLECAGVPAATASALHGLGRGGRAVLVGSGSHDVPLPLMRIQAYELQLYGLFRYANTWPVAIDLVAAGRVDLDRLVTGRYTLEQTEEALTAGERDATSIKAIVSPRAS
jgi:L-iditol 2-dehydrogenase